MKNCAYMFLELWNNEGCMDAQDVNLLLYSFYNGRLSTADSKGCKVLWRPNCGGIRLNGPNMIALIMS